jgi:hypothetical protein
MRRPLLTVRLKVGDYIAVTVTPRYEPITDTLRLRLHAAAAEFLEPPTRQPRSAVTPAPPRQAGSSDQPCTGARSRGGVVRLTVSAVVVQWFAGTVVMLVVAGVAVVLAAGSRARRSPAPARQPARVGARSTALPAEPSAGNRNGTRR